MIKFPMQKHHVSRFPWNNRHRLREEVAMDTIFSEVQSINGYNCGQVFIGLVSRMINFYPMKSKEGTNIIAAYQDFMRYEGVPSGLHRDGAKEERLEKLIDINREMKVKDSWSEPKRPNENPVEALGVNPLKRGVKAIMDRTGAYNSLWPWAYKYIADINNHTASPVLEWDTPISKRHGITPDISAFLMYHFFQAVYFKIDDSVTSKSPE